MKIFPAPERTVLPGLLLVLLLLVAVGCDGLGAVDGTVKTGQSITSPAAKLGAVSDGSGAYVDFLRTESATMKVNGVDDVQVTKFYYEVQAPSNGSHIALEDPACGTFVAASGATADQNENGSIEWHSGISTTEHSEIWYAFEGPDVPIGVVAVSLKTEGNDIQPLGDGIVYGPCKGYVDKGEALSGYVFLDRTSAGDQMSPGDDGIAGIPVTLNHPFLYTTVENGTSILVDEVSDITGSADPGKGQYTLTRHFVFPWWLNPTSTTFDYIVSIDISENPALDGDLAMFSPIPCDGCGIATVTYDPASQSGVAVDAPKPDFGFRLDIRKALNLFDASVTDQPAVSDGVDRVFYRVQATQRGTTKYRPIMSVDYLMDLFEAFVSSVPGAQDQFGGWSVDQVADLLKNANNNSEYLGLKTSVLTLGLNAAWGRGLCSAPGDPLDGEITVIPPGADPELIPPVCGSEVDMTTTLLVLEQAVGELIEIDPDNGTSSKAPTGTTKTVVDSFNNE